MHKEEDHQVATNFAVEEDYSLLTLAGGKKGLDQLFSKENIARAQTVIDTAKDGFFESSLRELKHLRETVYKNASTNNV